MVEALVEVLSILLLLSVVPLLEPRDVLLMTRFELAIVMIAVSEDGPFL